jgi:hypothetical protein
MDPASIRFTQSAIDARSATPTRAQLIRELVELVAALDRRAPHVERAGEIEIARDAAALKARAVKRIAELEDESASVRAQ